MRTFESLWSRGGGGVWIQVGQARLEEACVHVWDGPQQT